MRLRIVVLAATLEVFVLASSGCYRAPSAWPSDASQPFSDAGSSADAGSEVPDANVIADAGAVPPECFDAGELSTTFIAADDVSFVAGFAEPDASVFFALRDGSDAGMPGSDFRWVAGRLPVSAAQGPVVWQSLGIDESVLVGSAVADWQPDAGFLIAWLDCCDTKSQQAVHVAPVTLDLVADADAGVVWSDPGPYFRFGVAWNAEDFEWSTWWLSYAQPGGGGLRGTLMGRAQPQPDGTLIGLSPVKVSGPGASVFAEGWGHDRYLLATGDALVLHGIEADRAGVMDSASEFDLGLAPPMFGVGTRPNVIWSGTEWGVLSVVGPMGSASVEFERVAPGSGVVPGSHRVLSLTAGDLLADRMKWTGSGWLAGWTEFAPNGIPHITRVGAGGDVVCSQALPAQGILEAILVDANGARFVVRGTPNGESSKGLWLLSPR